MKHIRTHCLSTLGESDVENFLAGVTGCLTLLPVAKVSRLVDSTSKDRPRNDPVDSRGTPTSAAGPIGANRQPDIPEVGY
jgi:hypothetical protein